MSALVSDVQVLKACEPISVTELGIIMMLRLEQPAKAELPILITDGGMLTLRSAVHQLKAFEATEVTG
jgi:hypothetical protein